MGEHAGSYDGLGKRWVYFVKKKQLKPVTKGNIMDFSTVDFSETTPACTNTN